MYEIKVLEKISGKDFSSPHRSAVKKDQAPKTNQGQENKLTSHVTDVQEGSMIVSYMITIKWKITETLLY